MNAFEFKKAWWRRQNPYAFYVNTAWVGTAQGAVVVDDTYPNGIFGQNAFAAITDATEPHS